LVHLHLDPLGGIAGDMFVAALLDAFPEHASGAVAAAEMVARVPCRLVAHRDAVLTGARFVVDEHEHHHHHHTHWHDIRARIEAADLRDAARRHPVGIFAALAEAEGAVHGIPPEEVTFHEVGAADSIADIVAAATVIAAIGAARWSVGPLPLGGGTVRTAHGEMPVPAPATVRLIEGLATVDDGIAGERVTPTGAAILRHLGCVPRPGLVARLARSGTGFGTRTLPGRPNALRVLAFTDTGVTAPATHRDLAVISFEVDDQSAEDLAAGLDRLRALEGVHDVLQMPAFGKKGRMATHVQVLARPDALQDAVEACFRETTTIGLRTHLVHGHALPRVSRTVSVGGAAVRIKQVDRPGGATCKAEADDLASLPGQAARTRLRRRAEASAESDDA
jgi:uncharacterized protein (TIGR00299 family) protein